jgi:hypothetical protein
MQNVGFGSIFLCPRDSSMRQHAAHIVLVDCRCRADCQSRRDTTEEALQLLKSNIEYLLGWQVCVGDAPAHWLRHARGH